MTTAANQLTDIIRQRITTRKALLANFYAFGMAVLGASAKPARHFEVLADALAGVIDGRTDRLIVEMPPAHGKSTWAARLLPLRFLAGNPNAQILVISHIAGLAASHVHWLRAEIERPESLAGLFGLRLAADHRLKTQFALTGRTDPSVLALGVGGAVSGRRADLIIIDDPYTNAADAQSLLTRTTVSEAARSDWMTRLKPNGRIVLIQTRWHPDDLAGEFRRAGGWRVLTLPAIAEGSDWRQAGEALWPEHYPITALRERLAAMGDLAFEALYQQRPTLRAGGDFKIEAISTVDAAPRLTREVRYWDLAMSAKAGADYTVGCRMGVDEMGNYYITDVKRARLDLGEQLAYITGVMLADGRHVAQGLERAGYQQRVIADLQRAGSLRGFTIQGIAPVGDKRSRAAPLAARVAGGVVSVVKSGWTTNFLNELAAFPNGAHDDQVDAAGGAFAMLANAGGGVIRYDRY